MENTNKLEIRKDEGSTPVRTGWRPFEDLHREIDRLFDDFGRGGWLQSLRPTWKSPAVDISETDGGYEITAELPGIEAKNVEVKLRNGNIVINGEKQQETEEKKKDFYVKERQFGSFERSFALPDGVDPDKIEARFQNGVLTVTLPKSDEARKPEKKIDINAA